MNTTMSKTTYSVTTSRGATHTVEDDLGHGEAARLILHSEKEQTPFAKDIANKAAHGKTLSDKQIAWLHVLASWAVEPHLDRERLVALPLTRGGCPRTWHAVYVKQDPLPVHLVEFVELLARRR